MRRSTSVLVAAFVVVDLAVLGGAYALAHRGPAPSGSDPAGTAPSATASGSSGTPTWTGPLSLTASGSGRLARVTRGSCDPRGPVRSRVWLAASYLAPLREVTVPGLQETLGVAVGDDVVRLVGVGPKCAPAGFVSADGGTTWRRGAVPDDVWFLDRDSTAHVVHGPVPGGEQTVPCTPVAVTTVSDDDALVTCGSDAVYRAAAGGGGPSAGATNGASAGQGDGTGPDASYPVQDPAGSAERDGDVLALSSVTGCTAALVRLAEGGSLQRLACPSRAAAPLGVAASGSRIFVQVGYRLLYSTDGGRAFRAYPGDDEPASP